MPDRVLLLATEDLDSPATRAQITDFLQLQVGAQPIRRNVGRDWDAGSVDGLYF